MTTEISTAINAVMVRRQSADIGAPARASAGQQIAGIGHGKDTEVVDRQRQTSAVENQSLPPVGEGEENEELRQAVSDINSYVQNLQRDLQFKVDVDLGVTVISVVDSETKEIIRQLPPEQVVKRARRLEERANSDGGVDGLLFKVKI